MLAVLTVFALILNIDLYGLITDRTIFIKVCGSRPPTLADRKQLTITEAIMTEAFRLGTPASMTTPHRAVKVAH